MSGNQELKVVIVFVLPPSWLKLADVLLIFKILSWIYRANRENLRRQCFRCYKRVHICELSCTRQVIVPCLVARHVLVTCPVRHQEILHTPCFAVQSVRFSCKFSSKLWCI